MTGKSNIYDYDYFRELGSIARIANVPKVEAPHVTESGACTTRTQRAFWVLGWEAEDDIQKKVKPNETPSA
jgi:hypothetical protein